MIGTSFHRGRLWHRRSEPAHAFERDLLMAFVDVESIDAAAKGVLRLAPRWPVAIRGRDHLPSGEGEDAAVSLAARVRRIVAPALGRAPSGPMGLLTQPRMCGITFNPVSFVYCFDATGERVEAVVAEVTNTPWGERHAYVLVGGEPESESEPAGLRRFDAEKRLHVSPFFGMDHEYRFRLSDPGEATRLTIENRCGGQVVFQAGLALTRISSDGRLPLAALVRHPVMPAETMVGIYLQALRLALKRTPFHAHPRKRTPDDPSGRRSPVVPLRGAK